MNWIGGLLLIGSGVILRCMLIERYSEKIALGEELSQLMDVVRQGVFRLQRPLPELIFRCRERSRYSVSFWDALIAGMREESNFAAVWQRACAVLPVPYASLWQSLGPVLTAGEQEELMILTREEMHHIVMEKRRQKGERDRLVTAVCLSGSLFLMVVLI